MEFLSYEEFKELSDSTISEKLFKLKRIYIESVINKYTGNKLLQVENIPVEVKFLIVDVINEIEQYEKTNNLQSESIGKWSVTYREKDIKNIIENKINIYLANIRDSKGQFLLYGGIDAF